VLAAGGRELDEIGQQPAVLLKAVAELAAQRQVPLQLLVEIAHRTGSVAGHGRTAKRSERSSILA
jgi:hypothetical protein